MPSLRNGSPPDSSSEDESIYGSEYSDVNEGFSYEHLVIALVFLRCLRHGLRDFELRSEYEAAGKFDDVVVTWGGEAKLGKYALFVQLKHKTSPEFRTLKESHFFSSTDKKKGFNIEKYYKSFKSTEGLSGRKYALILSTNSRLDDSALVFFRKRELSSSWLSETGVFWEEDTGSVFGSELLRTAGEVYQLNMDNNRVKEKVENDHEFTKRFFLFCGQKSVQTIHKDICVELVSLLGLSDNYEILSVCQKLRKSVKHWKVEKRSKVPESLTSNWTEWQYIIHQYIQSKVTDCNRLTTRLKFRHVESVREHVESANPAHVRPVSFETMALTVTKVHQAVHPETHILLNVEGFMEAQHRVLRCWGPLCRWLVLVDDTAEGTGRSSWLLDKMDLQLDGGRRLIVVSMRDEASFQDSFWCGDVSDDSWDNLLRTRIRLNGSKRKCHLGDLVATRAELQALVRRRLPCLVALARNSGYVKLGQSPDSTPANYVPRQLVARRYVKVDFFSSLGVRDVCVMDNSTYQKLTEKVSDLAKHCKECSFEELESYLALPTPAAILAKAESIDINALEGICRKYKGLHVYTVKHTKCGWDVQSFNAGCGRIRQCVIEQEIQLMEALDVCNNKVIVEGIPGVGKSTMLLDLAREVKQNSPTSWVVWVNLRECCEQLEKGMSGEEVRELILRSVVSSEGVSAELELVMLEHCLQNHKDVLCLVDGFDEVCPDYTEECTEGLNLLSPRRGKLVVTARPGVARFLEARLQSLPHLLPPFTDWQLQKYFDGFRPRVPRIEVDTLTKPLKDLLRIPLFAEMYKDLIGTGSLSYDTVTLCDAFFHNKFRKLNKEQANDEDQRDYEEIIWRSREAKLKRLARLLLVRNEEVKRQRLSVDEIFVKSGIVHQGTAEMPLFEHSAFGEYFLAKWCFLDASQEACTAVYSSAQSGRSLEFFLEVFDRMASRGYRLLSAVVEGDEGRARALLQVGADPVERDAWGRSALHLAAGRGAGASLLLALCEHMKPCLAERDGLMHWTPLQYAAKRGHWGAVEALLQAGADLTQLGDIQDAVPVLLSKNCLRVDSLVQNLLVKISEEYGHSRVLNMLWKIYSNDSKDEKEAGTRRTELHIAILEGDKVKIRNLIRARKDVEAPDENGETALHYAVKVAASDVVTLLIRAGVRLEARNKDGRTALHVAALASTSQCAELLVAAGAQVDPRDRAAATPLHCAAEGAADVAELLVDAGADIEARDGGERSPLHHAALYGATQCAQLLVRRGARAHVRDGRGATPLHYAAGAGAEEVVEILTWAGASVFWCDEGGATALHYAAECASAECARRLTLIGADVNARDNSGATPLHRVARAGAAATARLLVDAGTHVDARDKFGATALHYAAKESATAVVELLVESGARLNYRTQAGITALHYAASGGNAKCTRLLITDLVSVNAPDRDGATPLHYAARADDADCAALLVRAGADVRVRDNAGQTPLHCAARACNAECVPFLVSAGLSVNVQDRKGASALHYAAMPHITIPSRMQALVENAAKCIGRLLESGAQPDTRDEHWKTALHYAVSAGNVAGVGLLTDAGCDVLATDKRGETALHYAVRAGSSMCFSLLLRSVATNSTS